MEEVVLQEVVHWPVRWHRPESILEDVDDHEPKDQCQGCQLGLIANRNQDDKGQAEDILENLEGTNKNKEEISKTLTYNL